MFGWQICWLSIPDTYPHSVPRWDLVPHDFLHWVGCVTHLWCTDWQCLFKLYKQIYLKNYWAWLLSKSCNNSAITVPSCFFLPSPPIFQIPICEREWEEMKNTNPHFSHQLKISFHFVLLWNELLFLFYVTITMVSFLISFFFFLVQKWLMFTIKNQKL